ncbi:MAG TPA: class I SAM-dependent methyltransferase [Candidatus Binatia bacterium]
MSRSTTWNPETYARDARFVSDLGAPLLEVLDPQPGELILDLGCGDGALSEKIAARSRLVGVDSSMPFLKSARARGLQVLQMDGQQLAFKRCFDAVFSNAALHWMKRPERVLQGVAGCLKPCGRFVGEFGGKGNVGAIRVVLHAGLRKRSIDPWRVDPWYYPSPEEFGGLLERFGFSVPYIELIPRPTKLPGDLTQWLELFAQPFTKSFAEGDKQGFIDEVRETLEPELRKADGSWHADYVRLRFKAELRHRS